MAWTRTGLRSQLSTLWGGVAEASDSIREHACEAVRQAMLDALATAGGPRFEALSRRIRYCSDAQGLWYMRSDLMAALASMHGEAKARAVLAGVTSMFEGLLPKGLSSRPSPLGEH